MDEDGGDACLALSIGHGRTLHVPTRPDLASHALRMFRPQPGWGRFWKAALGVSVRARLLSRRANGTSGQPLSSSIRTQLASILGPGSFHFAVYSGSPGPQRKQTVLIMRSDGTAVAYAKIGGNDVSSRLINNEAAALQRMGSVPWQHINLPRVIFAGNIDDAFTLVTTPLELSSVGTARLTPLHLNAMSEIFALDGSRSRVTESSFWSELAARYDAPHYFAPVEKETLGEVVSGLKQRVGELNLPFGWRMGDFVPWNLGSVSERKLDLIDWEYATVGAPPGWDLFHFISLAAGKSLQQSLEVCQRSPEIREFFRVHGLHMHIQDLFTLYLLDLYSIRRGHWGILPAQSQPASWFTRTLAYLRSSASGARRV